MSKTVIFSLLICFTQPVLARMYQWVEPDTGTTQLSGKPPAWYRSGDDGPRILVFEKGRLIDDTSIRLPADSRRELRKQAFILAEEDRVEAREKLSRSRDLKQNYPAAADEVPVPDMEDDDAIAKALLGEQDQDADARSEEERAEEQMRMEAMRRMVLEWEEQQAAIQRQRDN